MNPHCLTLFFIVVRGFVAPHNFLSSALGYGGECLQVGYLDRSRFTCRRNKSDPQVWTGRGNSVSDWMECDRSPDISRIDVFPCLSDFAGTDSAVRLALQSEKEAFTYDLYNTSLMKRASLRTAALINLGSMSLTCVIFLPPWSPSRAGRVGGAG